MKVIVVTDKEQGTRVDKLVAEVYNQYSRSALARLFGEKKIFVNGQTAKVGSKLRLGDKIEIDLAELESLPDVIALPILYEDDDVVVIDKPAGIISHARGKFWNEASVASFVRDRVSQQLAGERAGIVHRLDRATSGAMVCAKNQTAMSWLQRQFSDRKVEKKYLAIVKPTLKPAEAVVSMPIERNPKAPSTFRVGTNGKPAETHYKVLESSDSYELVELTPKTGRTHQLRVHLQQLRHPIVGDLLYGGEAADRLYLHAHSLSLTLPGGKTKTFTSTLPDTFHKKMGRAV